MGKKIEILTSNKIMADILLRPEGSGWGYWVSVMIGENLSTEGCEDGLCGGDENVYQSKEKALIAGLNIVKEFGSEEIKQGNKPQEMMQLIEACEGMILQIGS